MAGCTVTICRVEPRILHGPLEAEGMWGVGARSSGTVMALALGGLGREVHCGREAPEAVTAAASLRHILVRRGSASNRRAVGREVSLHEKSIHPSSESIFSEHETRLYMYM